MKNKLINFSISTIIVFISGLIVTLIISLLSNFNIINIKTNDILMICLSLILFFVFGFIYGFKEKKRGLINGLLLSILYKAFLFILKKLNPTFEYSSIYITIARVSLIVLGSVVGVNINRD